MSTTAKNTNKTDATVPAQAEKENVVTLTAGEDETTASRLERVKALLTNNKKVIAAVGAAALVATAAFVKMRSASGEDETEGDEDTQPTAA